MSSLFMSVTDGVSWESLCRRFWKDALRTLQLLLSPLHSGKLVLSLVVYRGFQIVWTEGWRRPSSDMFACLVCSTGFLAFYPLLPNSIEPTHCKCSHKERKIYRPLHLISPFWSFLFLPPWLQMVCSLCRHLAVQAGNRLSVVCLLRLPSP